MAPSAEVRPYRPEDHDDVYEVCLRTGDGGQDATGQFRYPDLLPDIYAGPYLYLEPGLSFVLAAGAHAVGYVLGTADTAAFVEAYRQRWLPVVSGRYPPPPRPGERPSAAAAGDLPSLREQEKLDLLRYPEHMLRPGLEEYPAHLHIDILPSHQGTGHGRRLMETFIAAVRRAGAPGLHLGVAATNYRAQGFYERLGFSRVGATVPEAGPLYVLDLR